MYLIIIAIFIGLCIKHACEPEIPADHHRNWRLEAEDAQKVRLGEMTQKQFQKNIKNGKYKQKRGWYYGNFVIFSRFHGFCDLVCA